MIFFISIPTKLISDKDTHISCTYSREFYDVHSINSFFMHETNEIEILALIRNLDNSHTKGYDGISNWMIKQIAIEIAPILTYIFNRLLISGHFPGELKKSIIVPIFKSGDKSAANNYRPISLLPVFSKLLEKIIKMRMINFLDSQNFFSPKQFGFRSGSNTEKALLSFLDNIYTSINKNRKTGALFIDLTKAFDLVDHKILLAKMWNIGFRGSTFKLFESYLNNRFQLVKLNEVTSSIKMTNIGVPQGSVLGPPMFLIYVNSIFNIELEGAITAFADDMALTYEHHSKNLVVAQINNDLRKIKDWLNYHNMILSTKTKFMLYNLCDDREQVQPVIFHQSNCNNCSSKKCIVIENVTNFKYLGLLLDNRLTFKGHCNKLSCELKYAIRKFYFLRQIIPTSVLKNLYYCMIQSRLDYGITCWGGVYYATIRQIVVAQKHLIRIINRCPRVCHSLPLFRRNNILPLRYLYIFRVTKTYFLKSGYNMHRQCTYNLRHNTVLTTRPRTENFRRYALYTGPRFFNILPSNLKLIDNNKQFCNKLKEWLLQFDEVESLFRAIR